MTPPSTLQETAAETRRRIVIAARDRFVAHGFSSVTMDDIARDLGMSKKTLYEVFPGKKELLRATTQLNAEECTREMDAISAEGLDFLARARKTFEYVARLYSRLSPAYLMDLRRSAPDVWEEVQDFRRTRVRRNMLDLLDQGVKQGAVREDLDREELVRLYLTMTSALLTPELSGWKPGEPITPLFETFVRVYLDGLRREPSRGKA